jgi:hypothetical protein
VLPLLRPQRPTSERVVVDLLDVELPRNRHAPNYAARSCRGRPPKRALA